MNAPNNRLGTVSGMTKHYDHQFVNYLRRILGLLTGVRYTVAVIRISAKGALEKLADQEDSGISVYRDMPDFQQLATMEGSPADRGWLPIRYSDLNPTASKTVFGWVGLVGETLFVAVADSAVAANLPADPSDIAGIGRNAFAELLIAVALAGEAKAILVPFRSRWWRNDLWANHIMSAINLRLPGCELREGDKVVATHGSGKLLTSVEGHSSSTHVDDLAEGVFEKAVGRLRSGEWDRTSRELPLGLGRARTVRADGTVELGRNIVETKHRDAVERALKMRARGETWSAVGKMFAAERVPMGGTRGVGKTYADFPDATAAGASARNRILSGIDYYRTGTLTVRRTIRLPGTKIRGIDVEHDPATGRRYIDVTVPNLPWRPFMSTREWKKFDEIERKAALQRKTGAATHRKAQPIAALRGIPRWTDNNGHPNELAPETPTAYRWRIDGTIEATCRRSLVHHGLGSSLLAELQGLEDPLKPREAHGNQPNPHAEREAQIAEVSALYNETERASRQADRAILRSEQNADEFELEHWMNVGREVRSRLRDLQAEKERLENDLREARASMAEIIEEVDIDITEPVLLATLLQDGDPKVDPIVADLCDQYGIADTIRPIRLENNDRMVRFTAQAQIPLADGGSIPLDLTWDVPDSHNLTGDRALIPLMIRRWAAGDSYAEIAEHFPEHDERRIRKRLNEALRRGGIHTRGLRTSAMKCPVAATRSVIAAGILEEPDLADACTAEFTEQVRRSYFTDGGKHIGMWCDTANLPEYRRVLEALVTVSGDLGVNLDTVARNAGVRRDVVSRMAGRGLVNWTGPVAIAPKPCSWCDGTMTLYAPTPETGSGLICRLCWKAEDLNGPLPEQYAKNLIRTPEGGYIHQDVAGVTESVVARDRYLVVSEVAAELEISASGVRQLEAEGELTPDFRAQKSARMYSIRRINTIPDAKRSEWKARFGDKAADGLLGTAEVAAILNCEPRLVTQMAKQGLLPTADRTPGGWRRFDRRDVELIDPEILDALLLPTIGDAAHHFGLPISTLRDLANRGVVPHRLTGDSRRFDLDELREALETLDLVGSPDNPIVSIGQLADHPDVNYTTGQLRALADARTIPQAGRLGGKRRFRLRDVLDALGAPTEEDHSD